MAGSKWLEVSKILETTSTEYNGHFGTDVFKKDTYGNKFVFTDVLLSADDDHLQTLLDANKSGVPAKNPLVTKPTILDTCGTCGKNVVFTFDGISIKAESQCPVKNCGYPFKVRINFPSGKVFAANDFRDLYRGDTNEDCVDVNQSANMIWVTKFYAERNMAHAFVGNSCPGVVVQKGDIVVGNNGYDYKKYREGRKIRGVEKGSICTDLWWFCLADYEEVKERWKEYAEKRVIGMKWSDKDYFEKSNDYGSKDFEVFEKSGFSFEINPGEYEMEVYNHGINPFNVDYLTDEVLKTYDPKSPMEYARLRKV